MLNRFHWLGAFALALVCLVLTTHCATVQTAQPFSSQQIAKRLLNATVYIKVVTLKNNQYYTHYGSGFVIQSGYVATNYHVVSGMNLKLSSVRLVNSKRELPVERIIATNPTYDLAILQCSRIKAVPLGLGNSDKVQIGETVFVSGNPRGFAGTFSTGVVSAIRDNEFKAFDETIQITAPISPGSSGGPVMNNKGVVIGVIKSTARNSQNINFAAPVNILKYMIQENVARR